MTKQICEKCNQPREELKDGICILCQRGTGGKLKEVISPGTDLNFKSITTKEVKV